MMPTDPKPKKTPKPPTKEAKPRKLKELTLAASDTELPASGSCRDMSPEEAIADGYWGCIYQITLALPSKIGIPLYYTGSKGFGPQTKTKSGELTAAATTWMTYTSSSDDVNAKLATGLYTVQWSILGYGRSKGQCLAIEAALIAHSVKQYGTGRVLNKAQVGGGKLTGYRSKYSKRKSAPKSNIRFS
jgi:hypothetical protein